MLKSMWTLRSNTMSTPTAHKRRRIHRARIAAWPLPPLWRTQSICARCSPWSLSAQHAGGIVDHRRRDRGRGVGIFRVAAETRRRGAILRKRPGRVIGFLDRDLAVAGSDDRGVAGLGQLDALEVCG